MTFLAQPSSDLPKQIWRGLFTTYCCVVLLFLVLPLVVIIPLSFNKDPYFTFTRGMLRLAPDAYSLRWYRELLTSPQWQLAFYNSFVIAVGATVLATLFGTIAAIGLARLPASWRGALTAVFIAPMVVPLVIVAAGLYFFFTSIGLAQTLTGLVIAHAMLGAPFVVTTVSATLAGFDWNLVRASESLGARPVVTLRRVILPIVSPAVISGALFAFVTSLDEVVVVLFLGGVDQRTVPRQMWGGIREQLSPTILAAATLLIALSILLLLAAELLRRRGERQRGITE